MATLGTTAVTLADWAKSLTADGFKIAKIVELLSQTNEILHDMLWMEGNLPTGHKSVVRTGIPSGTWRLLNYGIPKTKATNAPVVDSCGNLEALCDVDVDLADLAGNRDAFMMSQVSGHLEGITQQMATTVIYGNQQANPERFTGFAPRYNTVSTAAAQTAYNVIDAGGTGSDNTSIWIITWGDNTAHGIFPKGKQAGLRHESMGKWPVLDANNNTYFAYREHFKWECGLAVPDWRYAVRICNIDVSDLSTVNAANILNGLTRAMWRLPTTASGVAGVQTSDAPSIRGSMGRTVIYCNRVVRTYLDLQAQNKTNILLTQMQYDGRVITGFRGIPIKTVDAILNTEARIT